MGVENHLEFDWHPAKSDWNLEQRGFGFDYAAQVFLGHIVTRIDDRRDYGEVRFNVIGEIDGVIYNVTYTERGRVRWIISARRANKKECRQWLASLSTN